MKTDKQVYEWVVAYRKGIRALVGRVNEHRAVDEIGDAIAHKPNEDGAYTTYWKRSPVDVLVGHGADRRAAEKLMRDTLHYDG